MSPDTLLLPEHFSTPHKVVCGLPQLGGNFFESAHRQPGLPSMRIACPLVGTGELNSTSSRTMNLAHAYQEIRDRSRSACVGSLSCPCADCINTRKEFITALRMGQLLAPPRPTEAPPLPPSTAPPTKAPPRFPSASRAAPMDPIQEEPLEDSVLHDPTRILPLPIRDAPPTDTTFVETLVPSTAGNDTIVLHSPRASMDLRWLDAHQAISPWGFSSLPSRPRSVLEASACSSTLDHDPSPTASDSVSHISTNRWSQVDPYAESDWDLLSSRNPRTAPSRADHFEISTQADNASHYSNASWAMLKFG